MNLFDGDVLEVQILSALGLQFQIKYAYEGEYLGLRRFGKRVVPFEYRIEVKIQDEPQASENAFYRRIDITNPVEKLSISRLTTNPELKVKIIEVKGVGPEWKDEQLIMNMSIGCLDNRSNFKEKEPDNEVLSLQKPKNMKKDGRSH